MDRLFAFVSDIHGNADAFDAVLQELRPYSLQGLYAAGDHFLGGEKPMEVWNLLQSKRAHCIRGASDTALVSFQPSQLRSITAEEDRRLQHFTLTRQRLGELVLERVRRLPDSLRLPLVDGNELVMTHGSPADPLHEMSQDMEDEELLELLADEHASVVVCGGSHVPFQRQVGDVLIVNVGSVGAAPEGSVAHYTLIASRLDRVEVSQHWVNYSLPDEIA